MIYPPSGTICGKVLFETSRKLSAKASKYTRPRNLAQFELFYRLHVETRKRQGVPVQNRLFFDNIHAHAISRGLGMIVLARYRGRVIAGGLYVHFGRSALYKFGASLEEYSAVRPSNLVMWEAIQRYGKMGIGTLSLGRTEIDNLGLVQYKNGWGCKPRTLRYFSWNSEEYQQRTWWKMAASFSRPILRKMPSPLLRVIGRVLYPHVG